MAKINQQPPRTPMWPWGGPRSVRERLVDPTQFDRKKKLKKAGDPKNPALASAALMDFIGPAHSSEELRLPLPPHPQGHDADLEAFNERMHLSTASERGSAQMKRAFERGLARVQTSPERKDRLNALAQREDLMLNLVNHLNEEMQEIQRRIREEQRTEGY